MAFRPGVPDRTSFSRSVRVVTAPGGDNGFRVRLDALWEGRPGNFTDQRWVEETRTAAEAAGLAVDEYVLMTAQVLHRCGRCQPDAVRVPRGVPG
jgi:hypothetical protein